VQAARACKTRRHTQASACSGDTSCADVVVWTAGTCLDPRTPGPYAAGVQVVRFTKKSVVAPDTDRVLDTYIWYPALPGGTVNSGFQAIVDAPVDASGGPYPLLMFSHGSCGYPAQSPFLTALLATRGFIVVAPPHPGNTISELPNCMAGTTLVASAQERPADIKFVLDQMLAANDDAGSPFHGLVDPARLGMAGHSFGGYTVLSTVPGEPRFKVAMPLAPAVPFGPPVLAVPSLFMIGEVDTFVDDAKVRDAYAAAHPPKAIVEVEHAGHFAFSQGCFTSPDCMPPTTLTQDEAHALVLRYAVPFLEVYLAGDDRFRPLLDAPAIPGVTVQAMR
jgi:predicted dienelactone hydrolase